jgi:hypothetical protein
LLVARHHVIIIIMMTPTCAEAVMLASSASRARFISMRYKKAFSSTGSTAVVTMLVSAHVEFCTLCQAEGTAHRHVRGLGGAHRFKASYESEED